MTLAPGRVIDTHLHVWDVAAPWMSWLNDRPLWWNPVRRDFTFTELREELDRAGVEELLLVQACTTTQETHQLLELAAEHDRILGVIGWATLSSPGATERDLDAFAVAPGAGKLVGIRNNHGWEPDGKVLETPGVVASCQAVADRGLTMDVHVADDTELPLVVTLAERVPELTIIVDHLGKPRLGDQSAFRSWSASMRQLAALPNVYVKYSGWATFTRRTLPTDVKAYIDVALDEFGSRRVMYGGNWPVALVAGSYGDTYRATLEAVADRTTTELQDMLHDTAISCYFEIGPRDQRKAT